MIDWSKPSITDWINSTAALVGVPIVIGGLVKLFIKNKDKERKLSALENIAISQNDMISKMSEQIEELSRQTSEFQYHSELMKESNDILLKQTEMQNEIFLHNKISEESKIALQKKERLMKIRPHFVFSTGTSNPSSFSITCLNKGNTAKNMQLQRVEGSFASFSDLDFEKEINQNELVQINGRANNELTFLNSNQVPFETFIQFHDIDDNSYRQKITRRDNRYTISNPELLNN